MTELLTILVAVLLVVLLGGLAGAVYVLRTLTRARQGLVAMHADRDREVAKVSSGYSTITDPDPSVVENAPPNGAGKPLPVAGKCESCEFWSLEAGQKLMDAFPAFRAAQQWRQPWQLSERRNPEYMALEREIFEAEKTAGEGRAVELRVKLETVPEYLPGAGSMKSEKKLVKLQWADFGACTHHGELRAKSDTCANFQADPELDPRAETRA